MLKNYAKRDIISHVIKVKNAIKGIVIMKKVIVLIVVIIILICMSAWIIFAYRSNNEFKQNDNNVVNNNSSNNTNITDMKDVNADDTIEIRGVKYKNINSIKNVENAFNNELVYAEPIKDENEMYVKLSDNFFLDEEKEVQKGEFDSEKRITQVEMIPSKIYSPDEKSNYLYTYGDETYYIPVEKCESGEERIVYRDFGLEVIKNEDSIKINGKIVKDVISGWDLRDIDFSRVFDDELRYDDVSLCEAYMESWKISDKKIAFYDERDSSYANFEERMLEPQVFTHIYQVDFDDDADSLEFIYTSGIMDHVHIDSTCPCYSIVTCSDDNGIRKFDVRMLWFNNILNYKNVFYGYGAFEYGDKIDNVILIKESIITGYYIFDKEQGLIHVDRFANGEKCDEVGFKKLSEIALTLDGKHVIKKSENGVNRINAFPMYDRDDENPNPNYIEDGTKIYIYYINEDGYSFNFKTEDGTEFEINYYYT
jgi:hypothetical protein